MSAEASSSEGAAKMKVNVRLSDKRLPVEIEASSSVLELKQLIAAQDQFKDDPCPPETQRLIYSGRVLKDEEKLSTYKVQEGNVVHLVRSAKRPDPPPPAQQVPRDFQTGQQIANNPLAPLMDATQQGLGGFNPFADMGLNTNDPNMAMNMMDNPEVQRQLETLMSNPAMIEQIIQSSPQLRALGPQARQIMQSPMFRQMLSNPQMMRQAMQMQQGMARGGTSAAPQPGLFGLAQQQQQQQNALGNGPGTGGAPATGAQPNPFAAMMGGQGAGAGGFDPFAMLGGAGGMGAGASGAPDMAALQSLFGAGSPFGNMGGNAPAAAPADPRSPEERFETQLGSLREMGFTNASQNVRALLATGGNVEAAIEYILSGNM